MTLKTKIYRLMVKVSRLQIVLSLSLLLGLSIVMIAYDMPEKRSFWHEFSLELGIAFIIFSLFGFLAQFFLGKEIADYIKGRALEIHNLLGSGICDFQASSKKVNYERIIAQSKFLIIGIHYKAEISIFSNYSRLLRRQLMNKTIKILICHIDRDSDSFKHISKGRNPASEELFVRKISEILELDIKQNDSVIRFIKHDKILKYSFVYSPDLIWLIFYPNTKKQSAAPALAIERDSEFFEFIEKDIKQLIDNNKNLISWLQE